MKCRTFIAVTVLLVIPFVIRSNAASQAEFIMMSLDWNKDNNSVLHRIVSMYYTPVAFHMITECPNPDDTGCTNLYYDAKNQTVYYIEPARHRTLKITKLDLDEIATTLGPFLQYMLEMQKKGQKGQEKSKHSFWSFKKTKQNKKVGSYQCQVYLIHRGDQAVGDQCVASYTTLGLNESTVHTLFTNLSQLMSSFVNLFEQGLEQIDQNQPPAPWVYLLQGRKLPYDGIPVEQRVTSPDGTVIYSKLMKAGRRDIPPGIFSYPKEYQLSTLKDLMNNLNLQPNHSSPTPPPQKP